MLFFFNNKGSFTKQVLNTPQLIESHVAFADIDNDQDIDLLITGGISKDYLTYANKAIVYSNNGLIKNTKPTIPTEPKATPNGQTVTLSWNQSEDKETPSKSLTYNIYVGSVKGTDNVRPSLSNIKNGSRATISNGNTGYVRNIKIENLPPGTYYWGVQAIDGGRVGSAFSTEQSFLIQRELPVIQNFSPESAEAGTKITVKGKNFLGTKSVIINGRPSTYTVGNSETIYAIVPEGDLLGKIIITNAEGATTSEKSFCLIPSRVQILGTSDLSCPDETSYQVTPVRSDIKYEWRLIGNGTITDNQNDKIKVKWNSGGTFTVYVVPIGCIRGNESSLNVTTKAPLKVDIIGNANAKTETTEVYRVPNISGENYEWKVLSGGDIIYNSYENNTSSKVSIKWKTAGIHTIKLVRSNAQCKTLSVENTIQVNVVLNAFSFGFSFELDATPNMADLDGDGDFDLLLNNGKVYENKGDQMVQISPINFPNVTEAVHFFDFDQDNDPDVLISYRDYGLAQSPHVAVYENLGNFNFIKAFQLEDQYTNLYNIKYGLSSIDYENDGDQDILVLSNESVVIYENIGLKKFQKVNTLFGFESWLTGNIIKIDYDKNGLIDLVVNGGYIVMNYGSRNFVIKKMNYNDPDGIPQTGYVTNRGLKYFYKSKNGQNGLYAQVEKDFVFVKNLATQLVSSFDINNDGFEDLLIDGVVSIYDKVTGKFFDTQILQAQSTINFLSNLNGETDLYLNFNSSPEKVTLSVYKNNFHNIINLQPPNNLASKVEGDLITLSWERTPNSFYNIKIGTNATLTDVVTPLSSVIAHRSRVLAANNADATSAVLKLKPGKYYWSVQSTDLSGRTSGFSELRSFIVSTTDLSAPSNLKLTNANNGLVLDWVDNALFETGYIIERSDGNTTSFIQIAKTAANVTTYADKILPSTTTHFYRIKAFNQNSESFYSGLASSEKAVISVFPFIEDFEKEKITWEQVSSEDESKIKVGGRPVELNFLRSKGALYFDNSRSGNGTMAAIESPVLDISELKNPFLTFSLQASVGNLFQGSLSNQAEIQLSMDSGLNWIYPSNEQGRATNYWLNYIGQSAYWPKLVLNLSPFKCKELKIRIILRAENGSDVVLGLDDVRVLEYPVVPANIGIQQFAPNQLTISWDKAMFATDYVITIFKPNNNAVPVYDTARNGETTYTNYNLTEGVEYSYMLRAYNRNYKNTSVPYSAFVRRKVISPPIILQQLEEMKIKVADAISLPIAVTFAGELNELNYSLASDNETIVSNSEVSIRKTSTGVILDVSPRSIEQIGRVKLSLKASSPAYTAMMPFFLTVIDNRKPQAIEFLPISKKVLNSKPLTIKATSNSGLPIKYSTSDNSICKIDGDQVTILGVGRAVISASQEGDERFMPAVLMFQTLEVLSKFDQSITFNPINEKTMTDQDFFLEALSTSGLPVFYSVDNKNVAIVVDNKVKLVGVGSALITAQQNGDDSYNPAPAIVRPLIVAKTKQEIHFEPIPEKVVIDRSFTLEAYSTSGLPINYQSSNPETAIIQNNIVLIKGVGTSEITASQNGNTIYSDAKPIVQILRITKSSQQITFSPLPANSYVSDQFVEMVASSSSKLPINYASSNPSVAVVNQSRLVIVGEGITEITASQSGDFIFKEAIPVTQTLKISKLSQQITFNGPIKSSKVGDPPISLDGIVSSSSNLPLSYTISNSLVANIMNNTLYTMGEGTTYISATQAGDKYYSEAAPLVFSFSVEKRDQIISFKELMKKTLGDLPFKIVATSSSGLPVSFISSNTAIAKILGDELMLLKEGEVEIKAIQNGNEVFKPAPVVSQTLTVFPLKVTGIEPLEDESEISLFPNPTYGFLKIDLEGFKQNSIIKILVTDTSGRLLITQNTFAVKEFILDLEELSSGVYIIKLLQGTSLKSIRSIKN